MKTTIYFYYPSELFFELTNFVDGYPLTIDDKQWYSVEHYYQAKKFTDATYQETIRLTPRSEFAKYLGQSREYRIHSDWNERKITIMRKALIAKFAQHVDLRKTLLSTNGSDLVLDTPIDEFWGCGPNRDGQNIYGKLLMEVRQLFSD